jgi:hypothetical protein
MLAWPLDVTTDAGGIQALTDCIAARFGPSDPRLDAEARGLGQGGDEMFRPHSEKQVFVHEYLRFRFNRWERVSAHFRSLPCR